MKPRMLIGIAVLVALALVPLTQGQQPQRPNHAKRYVVTDLGTLGGTISFAGGINEKGWVNGASALAGDQTQHAFLWREGQMTDLGTLGGPSSSASFPLNDRGQVTGGAETSTPDPLNGEFCDFLAANLGGGGIGFNDNLVCRAFVWSDGGVESLPTLGGNNGNANQINNRHQIAGSTENATLDPTCSKPTFEQRPVIWEKGEAHELATLPGDPDGTAIGINNHGVAVGGSGNCPNIFVHGVVWRNGTVTDLGNLGGSLFTNPQSVNNDGLVVGASDLPGDITNHAFLWHRGVMTDMGTLPGDFSSFAFTVNERADVVGESCDPSFNCRAFLWRKGEMSDLNTLVPSGSPLYLLVAYDINSGGEIVGQALQTSTGELHAFLATPAEDDDKGEAASPMAQVSVGTAPKPTISENVRQLLQKAVRRGRLGGRRTVAQ